MRTAGLLVSALLIGCTNFWSVGNTQESSGSGGGPPGRRIDKVDLLLAIDNSGSMADKQQLLAVALSDLVQSIANPPCVDSAGSAVVDQPDFGLAPCPPGSHRSATPINDIHIGIVSSSLGGHGSDACPDSSPTNNDRGHLLNRVDPTSAQTVPTYGDKGFLAWDPTGRDAPPGESDLGVMMSSFRSMVLGVGQVGCGFESQLESWYRFLADPSPYATIAIQNDEAVPTGIDDMLLEQRRDFLRPDSLLAILLLSDEDDCSTKEFSGYYLSNQIGSMTASEPYHLPRARGECWLDENDPCCLSCAVPQGSCPTDPTCESSPTYDDLDDDINVRCWAQKKRFGVDFLYPVDRYSRALRNAMIPDRDGDIIPNPIFANLDASDPEAPVRDTSLVIFESIVGVPWQDIARDPRDLTLGYLTGREMGDRWDVVLGDASHDVPPGDPLMVSSIDPRMGTNPITGDAIAPAGTFTNPINGGEYAIPQRDDLQYACVFPIATPRDCAVVTASCDCKLAPTETDKDNPLCAANPGDGGRHTLQVKAKAYPGERELRVAKAVGAQGVVASICPVQSDNPVTRDYAYRPAVRALLETVQGRL